MEQDGLEDLSRVIPVTSALPLHPGLHDCDNMFVSLAVSFLFSLDRVGALHLL